MISYCTKMISDLKHLYRVILGTSPHSFWQRKMLGLFYPRGRVSCQGARVRGWIAGGYHLGKIIKCHFENYLKNHSHLPFLSKPRGKSSIVTFWRIITFAYVSTFFFSFFFFFFFGRPFLMTSYVRRCAVLVCMERRDPYLYHNTT